MFQDIVKTSISLPSSMAARLRDAMIQTKYPMEKIIIVCLHKLIKRIRIEDSVSQRAGIRYNREEPCEAKVYLFFNYDQQMTMRYYRMSVGKSVSFLIFLALRKYLNLFLKTFSARTGHNYSTHRTLMQIYWNNFQKFHLKIKIHYRQITIATCILPKIRKMDEFSYHQIKVSRKLYKKNWS